MQNSICPCTCCCQVSACICCFHNFQRNSPPFYFCFQVIGNRKIAIKSCPYHQFGAIPGDIFWWCQWRVSKICSVGLAFSFFSFQDIPPINNYILVVCSSIDINSSKCCIMIIQNNEISLSCFLNNLQKNRVQ